MSYYRLRRLKTTCGISPKEMRGASKAAKQRFERFVSQEILSYCTMGGAYMYLGNLAVLTHHITVFFLRLMSSLFLFYYI